MASIIDTTQKIFLIILIVALILFIPKMIFIMIGLKKQKPFKKARKWKRKSFKLTIKKFNKN